NSLVFLLAGLGLLFAHLLRAPGRGRRDVALLCFTLGLVASAVGVKALVGAAGLGRTTDFDRVVNHAVAAAKAETDVPLIVFSGASYSRNALDDERLTAALREAGHPHKVINLSLEAAALPERETHLKAFLDQSDRVPDVVFIEVAAAFDYRPAQFFNNSKFSTRGIEQYDLRTSAWTGLGLLQGGCEGGADCLKNLGLTGAHFGLNALNIGLVSQGEAPQEAGTLTSYDPQTEPRIPTTEDERTGGLRSGPDFRPSHGPLWITSLRAQLESDLKARGVRQVGYYFPPVLDGQKRAYVDGLCIGELSHAPCIAPTDPVLLAGLEGDVWFDPHHLLAPGANVYTDWLADRLISSRVLETSAVAAIPVEEGAP
ncbi:MAG: hypothetical protein AAFQ22_14395, partial [Pseudomonadota bacterium]